MIQKKYNSPLQNTEFRSFLYMRTFITLAFLIQYVVVGWEIFSITKNPLSLGLIGLAEAIPAISIALYAGHLADKHNKKYILLYALGGMLISSTGLLIFTSSWMHLHTSESVIINLIYGCVFFTGLARGFYGPTSTAFVSQVVYVPEQHEIERINKQDINDKKKSNTNLLSKAVTINSTVWQIAAIAGPAAGGFLYAGIGITYTMAVVCVSILAGMLFLTFIKSKPVVQANNKELISDRLKEGIRFVITNKIILNALSLDMFSVLFGGAVALLPVFADQILKVGPEGLGMLRAAPSVGAAIMLLTLSVKKLPGKAGTNLLWAITGFGITIILFGISTNFYLSLFILFLNGAFDSISVVIRANIVQLSVPDEMRGRVSAVNTMFIGSSNEIGAFESGLTARLMGTVTSVVFGGSVTLIIVGVTALKAKALKKFNY